MRHQPQNYWLTWAASLLFFVGFFSLLVPLPLYLGQIGLPDWQISVILGAFGVASLVGRPLSGLAADRIGYRATMLIGVSALLVGVGGLSLTTNPAILFLLRLLQALGYVAFTTASNALVVALAAPEERKSLLTRFGAAANVAMTLTPATINWLLPLLKLQGALWVSICFALVCGGLAFRIQMPAALNEAKAFAWRRLRLPRTILLPMVLAALAGVGFGSFLQFLPLLTERQGALPSGPFFALYGATIALTRFAVARWVDRGDQRLILRGGYGLLTLGLALFAGGSTWPWFALAVSCVAAGSGLLTGLLMNLHVEALPPAARGSAVACYYLGFDLGIGGGGLVFAALFERWGVAALFGCAAVVTAAGIVLVQFVARGAEAPELEPASAATR